MQARGLRTQLIGRAGDVNDLRARTDAASGARFFLSLHHDAVQPQYLEHWEVNGHRRAYSDRFRGFPCSFRGRTRGLPSASPVPRPLGRLYARVGSPQPRTMPNINSQTFEDILL